MTFSLKCDGCEARLELPDIEDHELALGVLWMGGWRWTPEMRYVDCPTCRHWAARRRLKHITEPVPHAEHQVM